MNIFPILGHGSYMIPRLFTTLIRFDIVYYGHFKCNLGMSKLSLASLLGF